MIGGHPDLLFVGLVHAGLLAMRDRSAIPSATELLRQYHASDTLKSLLPAALPTECLSAKV